LPLPRPPPPPLFPYTTLFRSRDALDCERERPHLRHPGGRTRPRVRSLLDGRLAHRILDPRPLPVAHVDRVVRVLLAGGVGRAGLDRKSTRLNSSHLVISYAVF